MQDDTLSDAFENLQDLAWMDKKLHDFPMFAGLIKKST